MSAPAVTYHAHLAGFELEAGTLEEIRAWARRLATKTAIKGRGYRLTITRGHTSPCGRWSVFPAGAETKTITIN